MLNNVPEIKATLVIYALCMVLGIAGNLITLVTMCTDDRRTKTVTNVFLTSLAVKNPFFSTLFSLRASFNVFFSFLHLQMEKRECNVKTEGQTLHTVVC